MTDQSLTDLKNIGETVAKKLTDIGVHNAEDLRQLGAAVAYRKLSDKNSQQHLPVCYYLYSLEGALQNKHWDDFSEQEKTQLRLTAGLSK